MANTTNYRQVEQDPRDNQIFEARLQGLSVTSKESVRTPPQAMSQMAGQGTPREQAKTTKSPHRRLNQQQRRLLAAQLHVSVNDKTSISELLPPRSSPGSFSANRDHSQPRSVGSSAWRQAEPRLLGLKQLQQPLSQKQDNDPLLQPRQPYAQQYQGPDGSAHQPSNSHAPQRQQQWRQANVAKAIPSGPGPHIYNGQMPGAEARQPFCNSVPPRPSVQAPQFHDERFQRQRPPPPPHRQLYQPGSSGTSVRYVGNAPVRLEWITAQCEYLEALMQTIVPHIAVQEAEAREKETFRVEVEKICQEAVAKYENETVGDNNFTPDMVHLRCFGSMASGFAIKSSDMDLALLTPLSKIPADSTDSPIPRIMEKALLNHGYGARLLTKTRVPIIKVCQRPTPELRAELLKEREKWENGHAEVLEEEEEEVVDGAADSDEDVISPTADSATRASPELGEKPTMKTLPPPQADKSRKPDYQEILSSLRQKMPDGPLSLGDYYGKAKNVLHILGGRDVGQAGSSRPTQEQFAILQDVCEHFVSGLEDEDIRRRLLSYGALETVRNREPHNDRGRSLMSMHALAEGERLLGALKTRPLRERNEHLERELHKLIERWEAECVGRNTSSSCEYNRSVHNIVLKLKAVPSLQLAFLNQGQHEPAFVYYNRVKILMRELGIRDSSVADDFELEIFKHHYVNGVSESAMQAKLSRLVLPGRPLRELANHHRILELINDYERASAANKYTAEAREAVKMYVSLLRSAASMPSQEEYLLPVEGWAKPLLQKIVSLPSPSETLKSSKGRFHDHLEFPKFGVGIQSDINFSASLALHNTQLLRCYCASDPRVKPMMLFVKSWAKQRGINTPYKGTLSSYGYVLMVLHYLVNIAVPFVCPNLQMIGKQASPPPHLTLDEITATQSCQDRDVRFWRDERELLELSRRGMLNQNREKIGSLLRGFFEYYAQPGAMSNAPNHKGFDWGREVLSLRTMGGIITKHEKGWVGAKTTRVVIDHGTPINEPPQSPDTEPIQAELITKAAQIIREATYKKSMKAQSAPHKEVKEVRHRYLFAIEDPFELDHNVARTVTHQGICQIRDELRRAWDIIRRQKDFPVGGSGGRGLDMSLVEDKEPMLEKNGLVDFMRAIHGEVMRDVA